MTHYSNTNNPIDFPVTKYVHIVQVHPVENGEPNLYKVKNEMEFETKAQADAWMKIFNDIEKTYGPKVELQAVYLGRVNDATGELE